MAAPTSSGCRSTPATSCEAAAVTRVPLGGSISSLRASVGLLISRSVIDTSFPLIARKDHWPRQRLPFLFPAKQNQIIEIYQQQQKSIITRDKRHLHLAHRNSCNFKKPRTPDIPRSPPATPRWQS